MNKQQMILTPNSCLNRANPEEPIFVLRANDPSAPQIVRLWAEANVNVQSEDKRGEAYQVANDMEEWHNKNIPQATLGMAGQAANSLTSPNPNKYR